MFGEGLRSLFSKESRQNKRIQEQKKASEIFAHTRIDAFSAQPNDKKVPLATYSSGYNLSNPDKLGNELDIKQIKPGAILRITIESAENPGNNKNFAFIVAGHIGEKGSVSLYDVSYSTYKKYAILDPYLSASPEGFNLTELDYLDEEGALPNQGIVPIVHLLHYLRYPNQTKGIVPNMVISQVDLMAAGEFSKNSQPHTSLAESTIIQGSPAGELIPIPVNE